MKWQQGRRSENVEDRRGMSGGGRMIAGGGIGTLVVAIIIMFMGGDPSSLLQSGNQQPNTQQSTRATSPEEDQIADFASRILAFNDDVWAPIFQQKSWEYTPPKMVLFSEATSSGCGAASSAMGPFYCPADQTIYMDLRFFNELVTKFGAKGGDFAIAYVIAHEVGHHIQTLLGTTQKVDALRGRGFSEEKMNQVSVATELQADFFAGVWARQLQEKDRVLEEGDIDEALSAASSVGDDAIQSQNQGDVKPESFTHGSSQQRIEWFRKGFQTGDINQGNTFDVLLK